MKKVIKAASIPAKSTIAKGFERIDYQDIYTIKHQTHDSAEEISRQLMVMPAWVDALFKLRNRIVGVFGLKTEKNVQETQTFFTIIENRKDEIVMGENDKHLNFRASILNDEAENTISLITAVHFNNEVI